jgi:hypothetical protein
MRFQRSHAAAVGHGSPGNGTQLRQTTGSPAVCTDCGIPLDAKYFDESGLADAPGPGQEVVLARFELHSQYCGVLEYFSQFTDLNARDPSQVETPGLEWLIFSNRRPLYPYVRLDKVLNPWGFGSFQFSARLDESATIEFLVRRSFTAVPLSTTISSSIAADLSAQAVTPASMANIRVGARLLVDTGASQETVSVISVTPTAFTAIFRNNHAASVSVLGVGDAVRQVGGRIMGRYWFNPAYGDVQPGVGDV